ncbi:hypothetical protein BKA70DRAFT_1060261, partial [Coprinopsis sp. MPI-PUGE-AT-0042]
RHQAYLIARVTLNQGEMKTAYRCVAAVHHQWCRREIALLAIRRLERLLNQAEIALLVREDLRTYSQRNKVDPAHPCPYAEWILQNAFSRLDIDDNEESL